MKIFINSNTSLGCLHSKDVVLHVRPDLLENILQCQLLRWYGRVLLNLVLTFPKRDFLLRPQLYVTPDHQELKVSILHWHHNLASVFVGSRLVEPSHFPSLGLNELVLDIGKLVSKGMTASTPKVIETGASPVDLRGVILYVQSTCGNSSTHLPFASSNLFFNPLTITLFTARSESVV